MKSLISIDIDAPIDDVFRLTNEHIPEWSAIVVEDEVLDEQPGGVGTTFRTVTEEGGQRMEFHGVVTECDPPHVNAVYLTGPMFDIETAYSFEDLSGRTRVTQMTVVSGKGFFKVIIALFGWTMQKGFSKSGNYELAGLKRFCENKCKPRDGQLNT